MFGYPATDRAIGSSTTTVVQVQWVIASELLRIAHQPAGQADSEDADSPANLPGVRGRPGVDRGAPGSVAGENSGVE